MSDIAIKVENLSKRYRLGRKEKRHDTFGGALVDFVRRPWQNVQQLRQLTQFEANGPETEDVLWALKDVSFEVKHGEVVGIIGRNGAGKSTLLKIISNITKPTSGRVTLNGRVASLLEVGTGFHPELTGRENVYLNGTILGMTKTEIDRKFDEIVNFAEVEKFIDTPVKRYSSGMQVRLAFSVAAHLEPEILLVDEVLAVGDIEFQRKCLDKMDDVTKHGRTVLFVSHNSGAVRALCRNIVWFDSGKVMDIGETDKVMNRYMRKDEKRQQSGSIMSSQHLKGTGEISIESAYLVSENKQEESSFLSGESFELRIAYKVKKPLKISFWMFICSPENTVILSSFQKDSGSHILLDEDGQASVKVQNLSLLPGTYSISAGAIDYSNVVIDWVENCVSFEILPHFIDGKPYDHRLGFITQIFNWELGLTQ